MIASTISSWFDFLMTQMGAVIKDDFTWFLICLNLGMTCALCQVTMRPMLPLLLLDLKH